MRAKLPILDNLQVASPCSAAWNKMLGGERVRHCGDCRKNVYNLSDLTRAEAEALIVAKEGDLCVRYFQRADGTILLADCTVGPQRTFRRRVIVAAGATLLVAGAATAALFATHHDSDAEPVQGQMISEPAMEKFGPADPPVTEPLTVPNPEPHIGHVLMGRMVHPQPPAPPVAPRPGPALSA